MKKILYLDLEFHIKTDSSRFLYELLEEYFLVNKCFTDLNGNVDNISKQNADCYYDFLVLWQVMPKRKDIDMFSYGKGILFPMYDNVHYKSIEEWNEYRDFTIINFSKTLHDYLTANGFESRYVQYFPQPRELMNYGAADTLFFWQRTDQIHANLVLSLCKNLDIKKVHIHKALDPHFHFIAVNRRFQYDITYSVWFPEKTDLIDIISQAAYYAAPRKYEGIGMSFLDAMAMGRCVIAPNYSTMNEYIDNGVNGILYDYENPEDIPVYDVRELQDNAYQSISTGYKKWLNERYRIIDWIEEGRSDKNIVRQAAPLKEIVNEYRVTQDDKYHSYYILMSRWMMLKNRNISLEAWFENKSIHHIALYGYSEMASRLAEELEGTSVSVDCYIDKAAKWTEDGRRTITIEQFHPTVDMVVITSFFYYEEIEELFNRQFSIQTVSFKTIVDDMVKEL